MTGRLLHRTTDGGENGKPAIRDVRRRPAIAASVAPRATWPLLGTIAATKLAMLSAVLAASRAVDPDGLVSAGWSWLAAPVALGGLAFAGFRLRPAPSAAGRAAPLGGTDRSGREPPAGRRSATGSPNRPTIQAWLEHGA